MRNEGWSRVGGVQVGGWRRGWDCDDVHLCARALCLEEMMAVGVDLKGRRMMKGDDLSDRLFQNS